MGFSELIIILVIVLIIFGAGRLPQIGEGLGKALKGFKKEVHEVPPPDAQAQGQPTATTPAEEAHVVAQAGAPGGTAPVAASSSTSSPTAPYSPGPEMTPGTTAALMAAGVGPQPPRAAAPPKPTAQPTTAAPAAGPAPSGTPPPPQGTYPPLPPGTQTKAPPKRPSAIVNKAAVARVQAQQAAMREDQAQKAGVTPQDMQSLGQGLGDALRTFRQAAADVRNSIDPSMNTIQAEMEAAKKEIEQSMEAAKQMPAVQDDPPKPS